MAKCVYLAWKDQENHWHVIGQLLHAGEMYEFRYTNGVKKIPNFSALPSMPEHEKMYSSPELFSLFKNRIMTKSRPEYSDYISWMSLNEDSFNEVSALAISGGERETDFFRIIPVPEQDASKRFSFKFFVHGLSLMDDGIKERVQTLQEGDVLYLAHDFQNEVDKLAILLRTKDPVYAIGYLPSHFAKFIHNIRKNNDSKDAIRVKVAQLNKNAPIQMRLLCELSFSSFDSWEEYEDEFKII